MRVRDIVSGVDAAADTDCSSGSAGRVLPDHPVTIFPERWRWTAAGYSLQAPARCAHGHQLGWKCGHVTWAEDPYPPRRDSPDPLSTGKGMVLDGQEH